MRETYQKESYTLFFMWLLLFGVLIVLYGLFPGRFGIVGTGKTMGLGLLIMLDLLFALMFVTQSVYWLGGVSYEEAARAGTGARRNYALRHLLVFLLATVAFMIYCFGLSSVLRTTVTRDSLVSGAVICAAGYGASHIRL